MCQNLFKEHTAGRYANGLAQKGVNTLCVSPVVAKLNMASLICYSCLGVGIGSILIYVFLRMTRNASKKHYEIIVKASDQVIDVTPIYLAEDSN